MELSLDDGWNVQINAIAGLAYVAAETLDLDVAWISGFIYGFDGFGGDYGNTGNFYGAGWTAGHALRALTLQDQAETAQAETAMGE